jgi:hypothetical protein
MKTLLIGIIAALLLLCSALNVLASDLKFHYVKILRTDHITEAGQEFVVIEGMSLSSSAVIKDTRLRVSGDSINLRLEAGLNLMNDKSLSGHFKVKVPVSSEIKRITYGVDENVIWAR